MNIYGKRGVLPSDFACVGVRASNTFFFKYRPALSANIPFRTCQGTKKGGGGNTQVHPGPD